MVLLLTEGETIVVSDDATPDGMRLPQPSHAKKKLYYLVKIVSLSNGGKKVDLPCSVKVIFLHITLFLCKSSRYKPLSWYLSLPKREQDLFSEGKE